jgi:hypothetical protein
MGRGTYSIPAGTAGRAGMPWGRRGAPRKVLLPSPKGAWTRRRCGRMLGTGPFRAALATGGPVRETGPAFTRRGAGEVPRLSSSSFLSISYGWMEAEFAERRRSLKRQIAATEISPRRGGEGAHLPLPARSSRCIIASNYLSPVCAALPATAESLSGSVSGGEVPGEGPACVPQRLLPLYRHGQDRSWHQRRDLHESGKPVTVPWKTEDLGSGSSHGSRTQTNCHPRRAD